MTDDIELADTNEVHQICDMSMISFLKIMAALKRSRKCKKYSNHQGLNARMPGFEIRMGYGLHVGWAIEGAIGSFYKIDASYLSPSVTMSNRLEAGTKIYGIPLLLTGQLYDNFTDECKKVCRQVDCVNIGTEEPLRLYTVDVMIDHLELEAEIAPMDAQQKKKERVRERLARDRYRSQILSGEIRVSGILYTDPDLIALRKPFS